MLAFFSACLRKIVPLLCVSVLLGSAASVHADPKPLTQEEQEKVDKAIDKGVGYLKRSQRDKGDWPLHTRGGCPLGQTLLPAYALLESGVPPRDPVIKKVVDFVRPRVLKLDQTYEVALAILFLDRLGDPKDQSLIRSLALRLMAGQHVTGGWNYRCPTLGKEREDVLFQALEELNKRQEAGEKPSARWPKGIEMPHWVRSLAVFRDPAELPWRDPPPVEGKKHNETMTLIVGTTDNSNTQFAILGLWAAKRHDIPVSPALRLLVERFERSQQANGWWSYAFVDEGRQSPRHPSMICVGLLGLAVGRGLKLPTPGAPQPGAADLPLLKGLAALSQDMGFAATGMEWTSAPRGIYYLWSVERVAMLYDLPAIGDKDWYRWGAGILIPTQRTSGEWKDVLVSGKEIGHHWGPVTATSFALLFLKHSHPMTELTPKLPIKGKELNQEITKLLTGIDALEPVAPARSRSDKPAR